MSDVRSELLLAGVPAPAVPVMPLVVDAGVADVEAPEEVSYVIQ